MPVEIENARLKLALAVSAGAPITVANDAIEMLQVLPTIQLMTYWINDNQNKQYIY